jgi:XTP/dITP diphosphohydrolase
MADLILHAATSNPGKLREFATSAATASIEVRALPNLASIPQPVEDAATFLGNAELKAIAYSLAAPSLLVFADDSGLEVDALGGDPGVRSARFADDANYLGTTTHPGAPGPNPGTWVSEPPPSAALTTDARNNALLLDRLHALPPDTSRAARFVCALALARNGQILLRAQGVVEGQIVDTPRGDNGFGYDPLFLIPSLGLTTAELPPDQKWSLSHRGNAFRNLLAQLQAAPIARFIPAQGNPLGSSHQEPTER